MNCKGESILVFDIETNASTDNSTAICRVWGGYSFKTDTFHFGYENDSKKLQELINQHRIIVGHNIKDFDLPIIERQYNVYKHPDCIPIDTMLILAEKPKKNQKVIHKGGKERTAIIGELRITGLEDNRLGGISLAEVAIHFNKIFKGTRYEKYFGEFKDDLDYNLLIPPSKEWNFKTKAKILSYLKQDLIVTKNLYLFFEDYFGGFKEWMNPEDVYKKEYINSTPGILVYKVLCNLANLKPEFTKIDNDEIGKIRFKGAIVFLPTKKECHGNGHIVDYNSLYPLIYMLFNLYTPEHKCPNCVDGKCPNRYVPRGIFEELQGVYCGCKLGIFESLLKKIYLQRLEFKKNKDPKQFRNKIVMNTAYGISASPIFTHTYNLTAGADCTTAGRIMLKYLRKRLIQEGYDVVAGDTDSCFVFDPYKNKQKLSELLIVIQNEILKDTNLPQEIFGIGIDDDFTDIYFFQDELISTKFKRKNYIYIRKDGSVMIHGLAVIKRSTPLIAKKIFNEYLLPQISETHNIYFKREYIESLIIKEIKKDLSIMGTLKIAKPLNSYKSKTCSGYMVSEKYGVGRHYLIPNLVGKGIGKGKYYCTLEEAKSLNIRDLDLETTWNALKPFIKKGNQVTL